MPERRRLTVADGAKNIVVLWLPRRPCDTENYFVVPSSLQMGWKQPCFCSGTEAVRELIRPLLALSLHSGVGILITRPFFPVGRTFQHHSVLTIFIDDCMNGIAGSAKYLEQQWVLRATLYAIHAVPPLRRNLSAIPVARTASP